MRHQIIRFKSMNMILCLGLGLLPGLGISPSLIPALGQEVEVYVSSKAGDRIASKKPLRFEARGTPKGPSFRIDDAVTHQTIAGFGASFLEAGMICLNSLEPAEQELVLQALFDPQHGAGFSAMKTVIAGTDFMSAGPWYTYDDVIGDLEMKHFSIGRDLGPNGLIPYIKRARRYGKFVLQAPMDYPPDWMLFDVKSTQDVNPQFYDALALYYLRYLREYEKNGIFIDYLSLFNEPDV
jgi:glucosylceramidase